MVETSALQTLLTQGETDVPDETQQPQDGVRLPDDVYYGDAVEMLGGVAVFTGGD